MEFLGAHRLESLDLSRFVLLFLDVTRFFPPKFDRTSSC